MADTGWKAPGTMVGNIDLLFGVTAWTNPDNAKIDDGSFTVASLTNPDESLGLKATNFDFSIIPEGSTILGVEVRVTDYSFDTSGGIWFKVVLVVPNNDIGSTLDRKADLTAITTTPTTDIAGSTVDLWNFAFTDSEVLDSNFGCLLQVGPGGVDVAISIDLIEMRVTYTPPTISTTGWKFPGTVVGNRAITGSDADWVNPNNVKLDDGSIANFTLNAIGETSSGLAASNFDFSSIPSGATIDGIEIMLGKYNSPITLMGWDTLRLILPDNTDGSVTRGGEPLAVGLFVQNSHVGGPADLWSETWSVADIQDVDFGFFISGHQSTAGLLKTIDIDFVQMRIFYHVGVPTTVFVGAGLMGHHPPYKSSGGAFYAVVVFDNNELDVYKTTDPTTDSWAVQDAANGPDSFSSLLGYSTVQDGNIIHIISWTSAFYEYYAFDTATDAWIIDQSIETPAQAPANPWASIAFRSDGTVVVVYAGDTDAVMGGAKQRVDYNIRSFPGGVWGGPQALDGAGDIHYGNPNCVLGTNDFVHCVWQVQPGTTFDPPANWADTQGRTIDPTDDSASIVDESTADTGESLLGYPQIITYDDAGTQRIIASGGLSLTLDTAEGTEDVNDEIVLVATGLFETLTVALFSIGEFGVITFAELTGDIHALYSGGGAQGIDQDLYYIISTDNGANWSAGAEEIDAITVNYISATIYVRGIDTVLAYIYEDAGTTKYGEKVLIAGALPFPYHSIEQLRREIKTLLTI